MLIKRFAYIEMTEQTGLPSSMLLSQLSIIVVYRAEPVECPARKPHWWKADDDSVVANSSRMSEETCLMPQVAK